MLETVDLVKRYGALAATDGVSLRVEAGEFLAVIGPNGAGKTTLLAQLSGELAPTSGRILLDGEDITALPMPLRVRRGLVRSYQITSLWLDFSALENVALAIQAQLPRSWGMWRPAARDRRLSEPAMAVLQEVGLAQRALIPAGQLAHGEQRQLEVGVALATQPRLLLLDEPLSGMGHDEARQMTALLARLKGRYTMVLVEHDIDAVFALADRICVLVYGAVIASGSPAEIRADAAVRSAYLGEAETSVSPA